MCFILLCAILTLPSFHFDLPNVETRIAAKTSSALTSLLISAPASSSICTMASSPRTQAYIRGVIPYTNTGREQTHHFRSRRYTIKHQITSSNPKSSSHFTLLKHNIFYILIFEMKYFILLRDMDCHTFHNVLISYLNMSVTFTVK